MVQGKKSSSQASKFFEAAREVGASEEEDVFDATLKKIAKAPPPASVEGRKAKKPAK